jgi:hypothetical protein
MQPAAYRAVPASPARARAECNRRTAVTEEPAGEGGSVVLRPASAITELCRITPVSHALLELDGALAGGAASSDAVLARVRARLTTMALEIPDATPARDAIAGAISVAERARLAPEACRDHAIAATRASIAAIAEARGNTMQQLAASAANCDHARAATPTLSRAESPGAASVLLAHPPSPLSHDAMVLAAKSKAGSSFELDPAAPELGRTARDHLAELFDPLVHDLTVHARRLRRTSISRISLGGAEITATDRAADAGYSMLSYATGIDTRGKVFTRRIVRGIGRDVSTKSGVQVDVPVGEYGEPMARAQVKAALALQQVVERHMRGDAAAVGAVARREVEGWTYQRERVVDSLKEGITSIAQATSLATSRRVRGLDGPQLLDALDRSRVIDRLAHSPMGFVAPIARAGWLPDEAVRLTRAGGLRTGRDVDALLSSTRERRVTTYAPANTTQAGCPVSMPGRSVPLPDGTSAAPERTMLADLATEYLALVKRYLAQEPGADVLPRTRDIAHPPRRG